MPRLSVWAIRLSVIHLVVAWAAGAVLMINRAWNLAPELWTVLEFHAAAALFGWILQLVVGVAYRMLPTFGRDRGRPVAAWTSVVAINAGVLWIGARLVIPSAPVWIAAGLWMIAVASFAWHAWPRIKPFGTN